MVSFTSVEAVRMAGYALATAGALLVFLELFQQPNYASYDPEFDMYSIDLSPDTVREYTWAGRIGALCMALGFAVEFLAFFV